MSRKIYVGNLSFNTEEGSLRDAFKKFGNVDSTKLISDRATGRSKGFAFIEMDKSEDAEMAIAQLNGSDLDGRCIRVNLANN